MGLFSRKHDEPEDAAAGGADGAFEVVDAAGKRVRYTPEDFYEIFTTADEREMRRHVSIGWLLLDEWVGRDPGRTASWVDTGLRRAAGRVLPRRTTRNTRPRATSRPTSSATSRMAQPVLGWTEVERPNKRIKLARCSADGLTGGRHARSLSAVR